MLQESPAFVVEWTSTYILLEGLVKDVSEMVLEAGFYCVSAF